MISQRGPPSNPRPRACGSSPFWTTKRTARDFEDCVWTLLNNIDPERDVQILDRGHGPVFAADGTPKLAAEGFSREWPEKITMTSEVKCKVDALWPKLVREPSTV